ncbi:hypothetical protein B0H13DRAFT_1882126 [Mycena leptocephala]|nr:hypothetical protein B0H13DRAFT_1882126 [Mycena leptocephala]
MGGGVVVRAWRGASMTTRWSNGLSAGEHLIAACVCCARPGISRVMVCCIGGDRGGITGAKAIRLEPPSVKVNAGRGSSGGSSAQSIRMAETLFLLKQACPAPPTEQEAYHCSILKSWSAHGDGEQIPGSGVWASLPRSDAFLTGGTDGPPLNLWGRSRDPRVGHASPASHTDASATEWHATTQRFGHSPYEIAKVVVVPEQASLNPFKQTHGMYPNIKKMVIFDLPDQPFNVRSKKKCLL